MTTEEIKTKIAELNLEADALQRYTTKLFWWKTFTDDLLKDFKETGGDTKERWAIMTREISESL